MQYDQGSANHQTCKGYIDNRIKLNIGNSPLAKLTTVALQKFCKNMFHRRRKRSRHRGGTFFLANI